MGSYLRVSAPPTELENAATVCVEDESIYGIDVSKWQGTIDWEAVAADGVRFAFIRVSDGLNYFDGQYARNWEAAKANGILRGTYQFFRGNLDPIAQADLLLENMNGLEPGDLPPVIDVESTDDQTPETLSANIRAWIDRVEGALGVKPIIYTGRYFWNGNVQTEDFADYPLWIPNWGVNCPNLPNAWDGWAFWQTSATGSVAGISGNVDENLFDGSIDELVAVYGAGDPVCGDGYCTGEETHDTCAQDCPICEAIPPEGRIIDDTDICFIAGGKQQYIRVVDGSGYGEGLKWTKTWITEEPENFGLWELNFASEGTYRIDIYSNTEYGQWDEAVYQVEHDGEWDTTVLDQTASDGWIPLGEFFFAAGGEQWLRIDDDVNESSQSGIQFVLDAIRLVPIDTPPGPDVEEPEPSEEEPHPQGETNSLPAESNGDEGGSVLPESVGVSGDSGCGCSAQGAGAFPVALLLMLLAGFRSRKRWN